MTTSARRQDGAGGVSLPITPMLDMSFQLLFFFITTFRLPTGMEGEMDLALPHEGQAGPAIHAETVGSADLPSEITIAVRSEIADQGGDGVAGLTIVERSGATPLPYSKDLNELRAKLADISQQSRPDQMIRVQGDEKVKWRGVVKVMDACRDAGFGRVSFAEPLDGAGR